MITKNSPIGVMDSGVGGISVLRVLRKQLPDENYIFYGDSGNAPYGEKDDDTIRALSERVMLHLKAQGTKAVIIACNTATSVAAGYLREKYPDDIIIGMEPAVKPAVSSADVDHPTVLVLATAVTLKGEKLHELIGRFADGADIRALAAPGIVRLVEAGKADSPEMLSYLTDLLRDYRKQEDGSIPTRIHSLVLGCTHFPFAKKRIREALGYEVDFYDGAAGTVRETAHRLREAGLLNDSALPGTVSLDTSSPAADPAALARLLLEMPEDS